MDADTDPMESLTQMAAALHSLASSAARLSGRSRCIPSDKDFHFYNNFPEFKSPARNIASHSDSLLQTLASSVSLWGTRPPPAFPDDPDDSYDWLVSLNDDLLERFGVSMDEFKSVREKEEATGRRSGAMEEDGFQIVYGKRRKKGGVGDLESGEGPSGLGSNEMGIKMASSDRKAVDRRSKVSFHIPSIRRPQKEFNIVVNNSNSPFEHVCLERSKDGGRFLHPLEKLSVLDFVDTNGGEVDPTEPLPIESTPFTFVDGVKGLKDLASKLWDVKEFAVDLEHNQYRSFQGLTCLMQISTRSEDFIVDTLKLHAHVGTYLREVFKDPSKRKVMHGADKDILWLQRDFGIYVCNLFDTGQASRVMQLERNSLEYLLHYFCGVNANKEYQNADWRLRPLPREMLKYGREDTHYLLYIYDLMRNRLLLASSSENDLLLEVYKRSYEVCMQLYERELLTDTSYLYIYGLQKADFNSKQLAIASGLCEWRDKLAREEDESTGYILPNKALLEIVRQMPTSSEKLRRLVRSKHPYVERHLNSVIGIIRSSIKNSSSFDSISEQLKKVNLEIAPPGNAEVGAESLLASENPMLLAIGQGDALDAAMTASSLQSAQEVIASEVVMIEDVKPVTTNPIGDHLSLGSRCQQEEDPPIMQLSEIGCSTKLSINGAEAEKTKMDDITISSSESAKKVGHALVQISKRQTSAFGALLGNSSSRRKFNSNNGVAIEREKNVKMVEQIKSAVSLPFYTFFGRENSSESSLEVINKHSQPEIMKSSACLPAETIQLEEVISLENESESSESHAESPMTDNSQKHREGFPCLPENGSVNYFHSESDMAESPMPLSDLSFKSINERKGSKQNHRPYQISETNFQLKPFDYDTARKTMKFGEVEEGVVQGVDDLGTGTDPGKIRKGSASSQHYSEERSTGFKQARRSQAFPPSGNRSASYR